MPPSTKTEYKQPILTSIFNILGGLVLLGTVLVVIFTLVQGAGIDGAGVSAALMTAMIGVFAALLYFGIGQVIDFLGRSAFYTEKLNSTLEAGITARLNSIEQRLSSSTPLLVRMDSVPAAPPSRTGKVGAIFYYVVDGIQQGPFTTLDMRDFRIADAIKDETLVFREGETQWKAYRDFPELSL